MRGGHRVGAGRKSNAWYVANGLPVPGGGQPKPLREQKAKWDDFRQALLLAEALLGSAYMEVKLQGKAGAARESLSYARQQIQQRFGDGVIPDDLVEAERLRLMVKRFVCEARR